MINIYKGEVCSPCGGPPPSYLTALVVVVDTRVLNSEAKVQGRPIPVLETATVYSPDYPSDVAMPLCDLAWFESSTDPPPS